MTARSYDLDAMRRFIDLLDKQIQEITEHSGNVKRTAEEVLAQFIGETADAFADSHDTWQGDTAKLLDELRALRERISVTHQNYSNAEQTNRSMLG